MMWELDYKENWAPENWCFWTVVLEKTLESLGLQGDLISQSYRKLVLNIHWKDWCWSWSSNIFWPPDGKNWLIWKDPDSGKDWRQKEKGMTEEETVGWHHWLNVHEFNKQVLGVGDGQGSLVCCSPWVTRSQTRMSDWTEGSQRGTIEQQYEKGYCSCSVSCL